jgi:hypothetical protein
MMILISTVLYGILYLLLLGYDSHDTSL